jgi:hypothetical protein
MDIAGTHVIFLVWCRLQTIQVRKSWIERVVGWYKLSVLLQQWALQQSIILPVPSLHHSS